jgi:hypothetical protein
MRHFPLRECGFLVGFIVVLAVLYVSAYFALVGQKVAFNRNLIVEVLTGKDFRDVEPAYPADWLEPVFDPIHSIDRRLRPDFWADNIRQRNPS